MKLFGNVILRVIATFVASALGVIGAGSVAGSVSGVEIPIWFSAIMGGISGWYKTMLNIKLAGIIRWRRQTPIVLWPMSLH